MRIGFIGLGNQGEPIARRMLDQGGQLAIWARRPQSLAPFDGTAATVAASPRELGETCDHVGVCVAFDADVRQVVAGEGGLLDGMKPGSVIAIHATTAPQTVIDLEAAARARGVHLLDAPVSGGPAGARAGTMTVMVGGSAEALELARPAFEMFATSIPHLGAVGAGQVMKLLNNNLCYANVALAVSALEIARDLGVDPDRAAEIMRISSGASNGLNIVADPVVLAKATGPTSNIRKDASHFQALVKAAGLESAPMALTANTAADAVEAWARSKPSAA